MPFLGSYTQTLHREPFLLYAGRSGKPQWVNPPPFRWSYARFARPGTSAPAPDETLDMPFSKDNAAADGFNRWTINGVAFPTDGMLGKMVPATLHLTQGKRYRLRMRNASDDIHPIQSHVRIDQSRRGVYSWRHEGCSHARWLPKMRYRLCG